MCDLIVSVPEHCLSFYLAYVNWNYSVDLFVSEYREHYPERRLSVSISLMSKVQRVTPVAFPVYCDVIFEPRHEKMCLREFPPRQDTSWPAQLQRPARILKFQIYKLEVSFCLGREQQRRWSDCADAQADLRLCCSHMALDTFSHGLAHFYCSRFLFHSTRMGRRFGIVEF